MDTDGVAERIIDECCDTIAVEKEQDVRSEAIEAALKAWQKIGPAEPYRQKEFLASIITENKSVEITQLSAALFHYQKGLVEESINQILEALAGEFSNPQAALHWLDRALHFKDERWSFSKVVNVLASQIPKLESRPSPKEYYNFCRWIWEDPSNASQLFSSWLSSGKLSLCNFLMDIFGEDVKNHTLIEISKSNLPNTSDDQIFIARKCVGFLWYYEVTAASILLSIVRNGKKSAREEVEKLLYNPLLLCYGGELRVFLESQVKNSSIRVSNCVGRLIKKHDTYLADLKKASHIVEFLPTTEQRRAAALKDRERNNEIQRQAHAASIFAELFPHKTILLYGRKNFGFIHGEGGKKVPSITPLSEFSYSTELPRLLAVDPVGFDEMLTVFRAERKIL